MNPSVLSIVLQHTGYSPDTACCAKCSLCHMPSGDLTILGTPADFVDQAVGGDIAKRLARAPEIDIIMPITGDHVTVTAEVGIACTGLKNNTRNL